MAAPNKTIILHKEADLTIRVIEFTPVEDDGTKQKKNETPISRTLDIRVKKSLLNISPVFHAMIFSTWEERRKALIELKDMNTIATETVFREFLQCPKTEPGGDDARIEAVWEVLKVLDYYDLEAAVMNDWFDHWYAVASRKDDTEPDTEFYRKLLYPAYKFNHAKAFQRATKVLAYNVGQSITESSPIDVDHLHLPRRVLNAMNAGRGRLKTIYSRGLHQNVIHLLENASCACWEGTVAHYFRHLLRLELFPLDEHSHWNSVNVLLQRMEGFKWEPKSDACDRCKVNYKLLVQGLAEDVKNYYHGLCLDCMDRSKPKYGSDDADYWKVLRVKKKEYDHRCRIEHGESTWYHSFMGRQDVRKRKMKAIRPSPSVLTED